MSKEVLSPEQDVAVSVTEVRPQEALNSIVEAVRRDSHESSTSFLNEAVVPHGGE